MQDNYSVYCHKFPDGKYYIGLTKQVPSVRWGKNGNGYKKQPVYKYIQQYGWDNIEHVIIQNHLTKTEAQILEKELIQKYNSINNGYNSDLGGGTGSTSYTIISYNDNTYKPDELLAFSTVKNLTTHDITTRLRHGWNVHDILNKQKTKIHPKIKYDNKYYTAKELLQFSTVDGLTERDIDNRVYRLGWDVQRALIQPKNVKKQPLGCRNKNRQCIYSYNGQKYETYELLKFSSVDGLTVKDIVNRVNHSGWSVEKALITPKKQVGKLYEYQGNWYTSKELAKISPLTNLTHHDITDRINRNGWSVEKAITQPKRKSPNYK